MVCQQLGRELTMLRRDRLSQLLLEPNGVQLPHPLVPLRDDQVDAVRLIAHVFVDPLALYFELLRGESHRAEHSESARVRDRGDHVPTMREGEDWKLDP